MSSQDHEKSLQEKLNANRRKLCESISKTDLELILQEARARKWLTELAIESIERIFENRGKSKAVDELVTELIPRSRLLPDLCIFLWTNNLEAASRLIDVNERYRFTQTNIVESVSSTTEEVSYMPVTKSMAANEEEASREVESSCHQEGGEEEKIRYEFSNILIALHDYFSKRDDLLPRFKIYLKENFSDLCSERFLENTKNYDDLHKNLRRRRIFDFEKPSNIRKIVGSRLIESDDVREQLYRLLNNYEKLLRNYR